MERVLVTLAVMAVFVLLVFVGYTWGGWRLLRWSRQRPNHRPTLGLVLAAMLALLCVWMILFRWSFSFSRTVNGAGTNIHVELGWLFLLPLGLAVAAIVIWVKALRGERTQPAAPALTASGGGRTGRDNSSTGDR